MTEQINEVAYCGIYCPNCGMRNRLPERAAALLETMKVGQWEEFGPDIEGFTPFWKFLNYLTDTSVTKGCQADNCGNPECGIRLCAKEKDVAACPMCADFPCEMIVSFTKSEPTVLFDGMRMKEIGLEKWVEEQEARRQNGFCYDDLRCGKVVFPVKDKPD